MAHYQPAFPPGKPPGDKMKTTNLYDLGWILQVQTNVLDVGLRSDTNAWFDVPESEGMISTNWPISPANPYVFFRLRRP
jgi:hypothetical protein